MKKIFVIILFLNFSIFGLKVEQSTAQLQKRYEGLFGMCGGRTPLERRLQIFERTFRESPWISGMLVLVSWKNLQPKPNQFDWREVDALVNLAAKYNRKVSLCFLSIEPAEWIYEQGVESFSFTDMNPHHDEHYGRMNTVPMPLSEKFYELWANFIRQAGKRYDSNPAVAAVVIMGVNFQSPETYIRVRQDAGFSQINPENVVSYWKRYIDLYMSAFPHTQCTLHIAEMFRQYPEALEQVIAYAAENYPQQFQIQTDKLHGRADQTGQREYDLIMKYSFRISVGFQTVATFKDKERQGSMLMTLMNGIRANVRYYELWMGDAADPAISKPFYDLWQEGKQVGWQKLMERAKAQGEYKTLAEDTYSPASSRKNYPISIPKRKRFLP